MAHLTTGELRLDLAGGVARDARRRNWTADMLIFRWLSAPRGQPLAPPSRFFSSKYRQAASTWFGKGPVGIVNLADRRRLFPARSA